MKRMKRICSMLLALALAIGCLAGCGEKVDPTDAPTNAPAQTDAPSGETEAPAQETEKGPITTDPITISILTTRHSNATNNAEDIWFFKYLEYWLAEQGYNVTIDVQQSMEIDQQISLALGTDTRPIWYGEKLSPQKMRYSTVWRRA